MNEGIINPISGVQHVLYVRVNHNRGFKVCDDCSNLAADVKAARTKEEKEACIRLLKAHHDEVEGDRTEVARVARLCKIDKRHVGFMIDGLDKQKCGVPTTEAQTKGLAQNWAIKQKLTGVQFFRDDDLLLYRSLPDVPLGGNLTLTIIADLFKRGRFTHATDIYINWDGAADNVCYHAFYGLAHLLRCAVPVKQDGLSVGFTS